MRYSVISRKLITISLILFVFILAFGFEASLLANGEGRLVQVKLKDNSVVKFEFDTFQFNWESPQIKDEISCDITTFTIAEVDRIYVQSLGVNSCDHIDGDWVFEVLFKDTERSSIQGFIPMITKDVTGIVDGTKEERTIAIENIGLIIFE